MHSGMNQTEALKWIQNCPYARIASTCALAMIYCSNFLSPTYLTKTTISTHKFYCPRAVRSLPMCFSRFTRTPRTDFPHNIPSKRKELWDVISQSPFERLEMPSSSLERVCLFGRCTSGWYFILVHNVCDITFSGGPWTRKYKHRGLYRLRTE